MSQRLVCRFHPLLALWSIAVMLIVLPCDSAATPMLHSIITSVTPTPSISPTLSTLLGPALTGPLSSSSPIGSGLTPPSKRRIGPEWVTAISAVVYTVFTIILALVAVFQDDIRRWRASARLKVSIQVRRPWCAKVPDEYTLSPGGPELYASVYYLRLAVENVGTVAAENVEVFVNEIRRFDANTKQYRSTPFDSMNLVWAYIHTTHQDLPINIQKYCDLAHVHDPVMRNHFPKEYPTDYHSPLETILCLNTWYQPKSRGYLLPPGTYFVWLTIGGTNCKRIQSYLRISLTGKWTDEEDLMASEVVSIEQVDSDLAQTIMKSPSCIS